MNKIIPFLFFCLTFFGADAQVENTMIDAAFKKETVLKINELMTNFYVFPDTAKQTAEHLKKQLEAGFFDKTNDLKEFADALTKEIQSITFDKHIRVRSSLPNGKAPTEKESKAAQLLTQVQRNKGSMANFKSVELLKGNVGYLDLHGFAQPSEGIPVADLYMQLLASSDAVIIDLRQNGGGSPQMVQYLCSYFFNKDSKIHLNSLYYRRNNEIKEFWTVPVQGQTMPDVPLYILTSNYTFSGAEEFAYNMQTQKRATLVGEVTGGGANPGGMQLINDKLAIFIPVGCAINPITKTNWEGVGVEPTIKTTADEALDKAIELATKAATEYRQKMTTAYLVPLEAFESSVVSLQKEGKNAKTEESIFKALQECQKMGLLSEAHINMLGYDYLQKNELIISEIIFKSNSLFFPKSANAFDSYGEALLANGNKKAALVAYQKAVDLATEEHSQDLEMFQHNLKQAKETVN